MNQARDPNPSQLEANLAETNASGKRRGPKGHFNGSRKAFLESKLPAYLACKKGNHQNFWHQLYSAWWKQYPWRLDDDLEPPTADPEEMARLASVGSDDGPKKAAIEKKLKERLNRWFANHASATSISGPHRDSLGWFPLLQRLHQLRNPRPRRRTAVQQFMQEYPTKVKDAVAKRNLVGLTSGQRLNLQHDIAKDLLNEEYPHLIDELECRAKLQHTAEVDGWDLILEDISQAKDVAQARDSLFDAVYPLLQAIGSYAGCYVTLIAGNAEEDDAPEDGFFTVVHWWPGDRTSTKNWTQWDEDAFSSGVAGSFLAYMNETNQLLKAEDMKQPVHPDVSPPLPRPSTNGSRASEQPVVTPTSRQAKYRPLPTEKIKSSVATEVVRKRKYASRTPRRVLEDSESEEASDISGDGSSSGNSIQSSTTTNRKRQRTSHITRSSTRTPALGRSLASEDHVGMDISTDGCVPRAATLTTANDAGTQGPIIGATDGSVTPYMNTDELVATEAVATTTDGPAATNTDGYVATNADGRVATNADSRVATNADSRVATNTNNPPNTSADDLGATNTNHPKATNTGDPVATNNPPAASSGDPAPVDAKVPTSTEATLHSSSVLSSDIVETHVPAFLTCHGKGKRQVNIFKYLNQVEDPHFQQILLHYLQFEMNDKSGMGGSLPTAKRPIEISQRSSRARPANPPNYTGGGRTFSQFVNSVFVWWAMIQPSWRNFNRGKVSRKVKGGWDALHVTQINGLLNVVILAYWWIRILKEDEPEDGVRADYEYFAEDVAWVLSNLASSTRA